MARRRFRPGFEDLALRLAPSSFLFDVPSSTGTLAVEEGSEAPFRGYPPLAPLPPDFVDISTPTDDPMAVPEMPPTDL